MNLKKIGKLGVSLLLCQLAGVIGSVFTRQSVSSWYLELKRPWFTPPSWVFAPAWITLFVLMGFSFYLVWEKGFKEREGRKALFLFFLQLALNILWSALFFGLRSPFWGLVDIIILWAAILATALVFHDISKKASFFLIPYLLWTSFALLLNLSILILNY